MKPIDNSADFLGLDCHLHSRFSPDAESAGADTPQDIADTVRALGLKGFIITDHLDLGHWGGYIPDFDRYFREWNDVREKNPDLVIYIGLEVGYEREHKKRTAEILAKYPFEYIINSVHYWRGPNADCPADHFSFGKQAAYEKYLAAVAESLDAPYDYNAVGHLGFPERYAPYDQDELAMSYAEFAPMFDKIIRKALSRGAIFEENTNAGGEFRLPRADFLRRYKALGGVRPVLGSDAHTSDKIGQFFDTAQTFLDGIFGKEPTA